MSEGYNYQLLTGIVKVIRPNSKPVLGIADGAGKFMWLPTEKIIMSHPMQFENWQTTIFAIDPTWKITWKDEQKWEDFKGSYPTNTKPILQPIPDMFRRAQMPTVPAQQPLVTTTAAQPTTYPQQTTAVPQVPQVPQVPPTPDTLQTIAMELTNIRKLLEIFIKPPKLTTADNLLITEGEVTEQYGAPPLSDLEMKLKAQGESDLELKKVAMDKGNINKDGLPKIF